MVFKYGNIDQDNLVVEKVVDSVNIRGDGCPPEREALTPCIPNEEQVVYDGQQQDFVDNGLLSFTGLLNQSLFVVYNKLTRNSRNILF